MTEHDAACSCGQLRLACAGDPMRVTICHCLECQRRTGSTFGVQAWFPRARARIVAGADRTYPRRGESGRTVTFHFCPDCGSTVFWEAEQRPELIAIAVGAFADPAFPAPDLSGWERRQHPWTRAIGSQKMAHSA